MSFLFGVTLLLCANVIAAPELSVPAIAVAAYPLLVLLLSVKLPNRALKRHRVEAASDTKNDTVETQRGER